MRNYFIILICFFFLSCSTAQEIINRGEVKPGMSQKELRNALISTSLSEDPFLQPCLRKYFRDEKVLIMAAETQTTFFIFENVDTPGNCRSYGDGELVAVRYNYQNALTFIKNNFTKKSIGSYSNEINSNSYSKFIKLKKSYIRDYKRKLLELNYLENLNSYSIDNFDDKFQLAITKFLIDEGECVIANLIILSANDDLYLKMKNSGIIELNRNNNNYCKNNLYSQTRTRKIIEEIYIDYIFTNKFYVLLKNASNRVL